MKKKQYFCTRRHLGAEKNRFLSAFEKNNPWCGSSVG